MNTNTTPLPRQLTALMQQYPNGRDREPVYSAFWQTDGREVREELERTAFRALQDSAGAPAYSEPGYWAYEGQEVVIG